jgi:nucleoid-associated protein EbfC
MKNFNNIMQQAQKMQSKLGEIQEQIGNSEFEGKSGGSMVTVVSTGKGEIKSIKIDPSLVDPSEIEMLEDLIITACNDAKAKADKTMSDAMQQATSGLGLPAGMKLPF